MDRACCYQVAVAVSLILSGCRGSDQRQPLAVDGVSKGREILVRDSVKRLREEFNSTACQAIFDEAGIVFRTSQSPEDWLTRCRLMRERLGWWESFDMRLRESLGGSFAVVAEGRAVFGNGEHRLKIVWHFDHGRAELFSLLLNGGEQIPRPTPPFRPRDRHMDPPPKTERERA